MALVIATGGIDLSVGSLMVVAGAVSMEFLKAAGDASSVGAMLGALGLALALSGILGAVNGVLVSVVGLQPFVTTLVMMLAGRGVAKVITSGQNTSASNDPFRWIANGYLFGLPAVFLIAIAIVVLVSLVVRRSALGLMIEAIGINPQASRMAGVKPRGLIISVYTIGGVLAGIAGVFAVSSAMTVDVSRTGYQIELDAILAVVIGGTALIGGKFSLAARPWARCSSPHSTDGRIPRGLLVGHPRVQGGGDHRLPAAVEARADLHLRRRAGEPPPRPVERCRPEGRGAGVNIRRPGRPPAVRDLTGRVWQMNRRALPTMAAWCLRGHARVRQAPTGCSTTRCRTCSSTTLT